MMMSMKQKLQENLKKTKQKLQENLGIFKQKLQNKEQQNGPQLYGGKVRGEFRINPKVAVGAAAALAVFGAVLWFFVHFSVRDVIVLGNVHYTKEEISQTVQRGLFGNNTLVVSRSRKSFSPDNLDLVDQIDVEMKDSHTLQITVQERQLIGYVQYLDCNLFFDSEGRVMNSVVRQEETQEEGTLLTAEAVGKTATSYVAAMKEAPLIRGLSFAWARLHEILPVDDDSVFNTILGITRMINKYSISPDAVEFDEEMNISLVYDGVTVNLGPDKLMEEKLSRVAAILPSIEGKQGILHMEDYDGSSENIVFSQTLLAAEEIDEEEDTQPDTENDDTEADDTETVSHEYAMVDWYGAVKLRRENARQVNTVQSTGNVQQQTGSQSTGDTQQQTGSQGTGNTQQGSTGQGTGSSQQQTTEQGAGSTQQQNGSSSSQGTQQIQIDKPVLNNLP